MGTVRRRERYQLVVSVVTGVLAVATVASTGALSGLAAQATARRDHERSRPSIPDGAPASLRRSDRLPVLWRSRPERTVVRRRAVPLTHTTTSFELGGSTPTVRGPSAGGTPPGGPSTRPGPISTITAHPQPSQPPTTATTSAS